MSRPRPRDLGIITGTLRTGNWNAITDVPGVRVGYATVIQDTPKVVRTGVTAIWPCESPNWATPVFAGAHSFNGNGEVTGMAWIAEQGLLTAPICITNTNCVGTVRDAVCKLAVRSGAPQLWHLPVTGETCDGFLSDPSAFVVTEETAFAALETAVSGPLAEGNVGGGTGMICYEFKGGNGTASRKIDINVDRARPAGTAEETASAARTYTVGVFVQANCGRRPQLTIAGVPVGKEIPGSVYKEEAGSIIIVVATDAPLLANQLKRLARRSSLGLARTGSISGNGSGDLFIAFSTANPNVASADQITHSVQTIPNDLMDPIFSGVVQATDEAIVNALVDNQSMTGANNHRVESLPHDRLREILKKYDRISQ